MIKHADTERIREDRSAVTGASWFSSGEALRENHEDHFHADEDENTKEDEEDDDDEDDNGDNKEVISENGNGPVYTGDLRAELRVKSALLSQRVYTSRPKSARCCTS